MAERNYSGWKKFPDTAPTDGTYIIVGGFTKKREWVDVITRFGTFRDGWNSECRGQIESKNKWITVSFMTLENYTDVKWVLWHPKPKPPPPFKQ